MENKKKFNIIRTQLYHSPCGDLILGSFGDKLCLCDWTIEKHRIAVDKRILQNLQACYEEKTSDTIEKANISIGNGQHSIYLCFLSVRNFRKMYGIN